MKTIYLTVDAEHIQFGQLAELVELVANALHPLKDDATVAEMAAHGATRIEWEAGFFEAVRSGKLSVKNPVTFLPHSFPMGHALQTALVAVSDICLFLEENGIKIELKKPKYGTAKRWTDEELERIEDFRSSHTEEQTAKHFGVSRTRVRGLISKLKLQKTVPKTEPLFALFKK